MIIMGALFPLSADITHQMESIQAFKLGFIEGYQTLDVLASVIFSSIIIAAAKAKGYEKLKDKNRIVTSAGCLATFCLLLIYGGLVFLGAKSGYPVSTDVKRAELLLFISHKIFGSYGVLAISISIALACLTTAIALTCAVGTFFSQLFNNRITYEWIVIICCLFQQYLRLLESNILFKLRILF